MLLHLYLLVNKKFVILGVIPIEKADGKRDGSIGKPAISLMDCASRIFCKTRTKIAGTVEPDPALTARYEAQYQKFKQIYPTVKGLFPVLQ